MERELTESFIRVSLQCFFFHLFPLLGKKQIKKTRANFLFFYINQDTLFVSSCFSAFKLLSWVFLSFWGFFWVSFKLGEGENEKKDDSEWCVS